MAKNFWLMKSEPDVYSIDALQKDKKTLWTGVRNYQARNFMMKDMKVGDLVLFYHSNAEPSGIAGLAEVSTTSIPDPTQFDRKSEYFDPASTKEKPRWYCVEVKYKEKFTAVLSLSDLKAIGGLESMLVLKKGQRLSVQPVTEKEFELIHKAARKPNA